MIRSRVGSLAFVALVACGVPPRHVHDPLEYPETKVASSGFELDVVDARPSAALPSVKQLVLPRRFEARAEQRLATAFAGQGPPLHVRVGVVAADELELVDARGEMTRVVVRLNIEVKVKDGPVLGRVETQSSSDLPRDEASPDEIALVLDATADNAFDRYWANPATPTQLNRNLAAYEQKH
jgi:hypothetical protein